MSTKSQQTTMDGQPIDNLFKRKLHDAEIKPSASAWATLEAKRSHRWVVPVWAFMAIAASLLVVGAFGWWALQSQDSFRTPIPVAIRVTPALPTTVSSRQADAQVAKTDVAISINISKQLPPTESLKKKTLGDSEYKSDKILQKSVPQETLAGTRTVNVITAKIEIPRLDANLPLVAATQEMHKDAIAPAPERTLIVSIDIPIKVIATSDELATAGDSVAPKTGFGSLLRKVKRIKDGDVFALNAANLPKASRRGFGKFYEGVKESIKNNSAD